MTTQVFSTSFSADQTPDQVIAAVNNVCGWWFGEITGDTNKLGAEFTYRYKNKRNSKQKITEFVPGKKIEWHVTDAELTFVTDRKEWLGADIVFQIAKKGDKTELRFTHLGLVTTFECYDGCSDAWGALVDGNLRRLIETGKNQPEVFA